MNSRLFSCAACLALAVPVQASVVADFAADFSSAANPSGAWSYGYVAAPGATPTLSSFVSSYGPANQVKAWSPSGTFWPTVGLNTGATPVSFGAGNAITLGVGQGILHPGATGLLANVRYTATFAFTGILDAAFSGVDAVGTSTNVYVLRNGVSLFGGNINGYGQTLAYAAPITLAAGDVVDFAVGWGSNGNYVDDSTGFRAAFLTATVPEPASWAMLVAGFGLLGGVLRTSRRAVRLNNC
jgi:hypothetical protein